MLGTWRELVSGQVRCRVSLLNERRGIKYAVSRYETLSECQSQSLNIADKYHITGLEQRPAEPAAPSPTVASTPIAAAYVAGGILSVSPERVE